MQPSPAPSHALAPDPVPDPAPGARAQRRLRKVDLVIVGLPLVIGFVLLLPLLGLADGSTDANGATPAGVVLGALTRIAIGLALITLAVTVARRMRSGLVLGIVAGLGGLGAGLAALPTAGEYADRGGLGEVGAAVVLIAVGIVWIVSIAVLAGLRTSRASFTGAWRRGDTLALGLVIALGVAFVPVQTALSAVVAGEAQRLDASREDVQATIAAMTLQVRLVEAAVVPVSNGAAPGQRAVERLVIDVDVQSPESLELATFPLLCLTQVHVTPYAGTGAADLCWGVPKADAAMAEAWNATGLLIPAGTTRVRLSLAREGSTCAFPPGSWTAELELAPGTKADSAGLGLGRVRTSFEIPNDGLGMSGPVPPTTVGDTCLL